MLQALREKTSGWIAKIVLGLLVFVFSFFGIESYFVTRNDTFAAKVGDHEISQQDFRTRFNEFRQQAMQRGGDQVDPAMFEKPEIKRQVLDSMINQQVLVQTNQDLGIVVPDDRVRQEIMKVPAFQVDGHFDADSYKVLLSQQGMSPVSFQHRVRQDLETRVIPSAVTATSFATKAEVDEYIRLRDQTRDVRYLELTAAEADPSGVGDADIQSYYKSHQKDFMTPEKVALNYLELDASDLKTNVTPDEQALHKRYQQEKARFAVPAQRQVSHILIKVPEDAGPEAQKKAQAEAAKLAGQARAGEDFAKLAQKYSDDAGSKRQGGDLGWIEKGITDPAFESAAFALTKPGIAGPVHTSDGYHVIDVRAVREGRTRPFDEVKSELSSELLDSERERKFSEVAGKLTDKIYQDPGSLEPASKAMDLPVQHTGLFARKGGEGIAANPDVIKAAFSDAVLDQDTTSDPIDLGPNHIVVVHLAEHQPSKPKPLQQVRAEIIKRIAVERADQVAKKQADALFARFQKGASLDQLAARTHAEVKQVRGLKRSAVSQPGALVDAAFKLPQPGKGGESRSLVPLSKGHYALVALDAVHPGDPTAIGTDERNAVSQQIQRLYGMAAQQELLDALRGRTDVKVAEDRL